MKFKPNNINPKGRPKVYFCCHPNDFDGYFESISNEILEKQKCTIWYAENEDERNDEYLSKLKEMQLFVMPVTTNLLCAENIALDVEFIFAIENHIPVLPLMQEAGLEELFNKKCGDLQFLDKQNTDMTAISYNEKLEKYLSSILIGDELAEKIRAAFDAYVFLSYRKKDRKYAQELMHLIHNNEFCRDIAIWYDEFLTPGENFNDLIKEALKKSDLFVLTVTPNLVNEKNYVMTEEYPLAQKEGKIILPAEMVETNKSELFSTFKNIPKCINARNEDEFSNTLLKTIKEIAIKENERTPEHNFFIGLAYFNGIDVEVDREKAMRIIIESANSNCLMAVKFLADCYKFGKGVPVNHQSYVDWEEKLIRVYQNEFINTNNSNSGYLLVNELLSFSKDLLEWRYIDESISVANTALAEFKKINDNGERHLSVLCNCYECIADSYFEKEPRISDQYYLLIQLILEKEIEKTNNDYYVHKLCSCLCRRFDIAKDDNDEKANIIIQELHRILKTNFSNSSGVGERRILSLVLERKGNILVDKNKYNEAIDVFKEKRCIDSNLYEETKNLNDLRNETIAIEKLADIELSMESGSIDVALNYYEEVLEKSKIIVGKSNSIESLRDLAIAYENIGNLYGLKNCYIETIEYYMKAYEIRLQLYRSVKSVQSMEDCGISCYKIGVLTKDKQLLNSAYETFSLLSISTNRKSWHKDILLEIQRVLLEL